MKKKLKIVILIIFILLAIILVGIDIFYQFLHVNISKPYITTFETSLDKKNEEKSNYEEAINEVERQVQQEFDRLNN